MSKSDSVNHPAHYQGDYECIDLMREIYGDEMVRSFCILNAYKYRFRAGAKQTETANDDIAKAEWYEKYIMEKVPTNYAAYADRRSKRKMAEEVDTMRRTIILDEMRKNAKL